MLGKSLPSRMRLPIAASRGRSAAGNGASRSRKPVNTIVVSRCTPGVAPGEVKKLAVLGRAQVSDDHSQPPPTVGRRPRSAAADRPRPGERPRGPRRSAGAAEELEGAEGREPGRQQGPHAGRVARGDGGDGELAGGEDAQRAGGQPRSAALPAPPRFQLETQLGKPGDAPADGGERGPARIRVAQYPGLV